jgi:hypothetical protein
MSKKKPKTKVKQTAARKKAPAKKAPPKKKGRSGRVSPAILAPVASKRTAAATIFIYKNEGGYRVRTSPQLLTAPLGHLEWTVVNLVNDEPVDVEISWPNGGPWGADPITIKNGNERKSLVDAKPGRYKYNVTANGYTEDPEIEFPDGN